MAMSLMGNNQSFDSVKRDSMNLKSNFIDSGSRKRPVLAIRTVPPLLQQTNDNMSPTPMTMRQSLDPVPKICNNLRGMELGTDTSTANGHRRNGKVKTDNAFYTGRKGNEPTLSSKIRDILEWRTMKSGSGTGVHLEKQDNGDNESAKKTKKTSGGMRDLWKSRQIESLPKKGPKAGQMYEIVNQHIIEDSVDKTVTISTWRERADEGHGSDTDNTSIYYISPSAYAREDAQVNANFGRRLLVGHGSRRETQGRSDRIVEANGGHSSTRAKVRSVHLPSYNS